MDVLSSKWLALGNIMKRIRTLTQLHILESNDYYWDDVLIKFIGITKSHARMTLTKINKNAILVMMKSEWV